MPLIFKNNKGLDSGSNPTKIISSNDITSTGVFRSKVNVDGIILNYDAADIDSFPPKTTTTNIITNAIHMNGWSDYVYGNDGKFTTEFNTTGYRMINRGSWNGIVQSFTLPSTGTYTFSAWYRWWSSGSGNNGATAYVSGYGQGDTADGIDTSVSKVGVWQRVSHTINASATTGYFYIISYGGTYGGSNSTWDVTMPMIESGGSMTPWVNGTNGTAVIDTSNYGNNAIANSATGWVSTFGGAWTFNGSTSAIDLNSPLPEICGNSPFTVEVWYQKDTVNYGVLFGNYGSGYGNGIWMFNGGLYIQGSCYDSGYTGSVDGTPRQIVVSRDANGVCRVYKNGTLTATALLTGSVPNSINFRIGNDVNVNGEAFSGNIYIVRAYKRLLNQYEIAENYNAVKERFSLT
jgi:hypothetical protein